MLPPLPHRLGLGLGLAVFLIGVSGFTPAGPQIAGCSLLPADNIWNVAVDTLPVDARSAAYVDTIGSDVSVHADFGSGIWPPQTGGPIGIPFVEVGAAQPRVAVYFLYDEESDPGPYPIPPAAPIEGGDSATGDRHVLVVDRSDCVLYELFSAYPLMDGSWEAGSGARFDLLSNDLRPAGWTSADAAGLPILPGLVRYDEVASGEIRHALRFTAPQTRRDYVWPARHFASSLSEPRYPPMGQRFRLRSDFPLAGFSSEAQVILQALKTYGMLLADNGSAWYLSGVPDERWDNDVLRELRQVRGADFEAVDVSSLLRDADSAGTSDVATDGCPPGPAAVVQNVTYPSGSVTDCQVPASITAGPGVLLASGSEVTYDAPLVILANGFTVAAGGLLELLANAGARAREPSRWTPPRKLTAAKRPPLRARSGNLR